MTVTKLESIVTYVTKETLAQMAQDPTRKLKTFNIGYKPMKIKPKINTLEGTKNYAQWSRRMTSLLMSLKLSRSKSTRLNSSHVD